MWHWTMVDHGWQHLIFILRQYLSQCPIGTWFTIVDHNYKPKGFILNHRINIINLINNILCSNNICHNATLEHHWPWLTMIDFLMETIFVTIQHSMMIDFHNEKIFVTMWYWTIVYHDYKWRGFMLDQSINIIKPVNNIKP